MDSKIDLTLEQVLYLIKESYFFGYKDGTKNAGATIADVERDCNEKWERLEQLHKRYLENHKIDGYTGPG